jgi:NAD(P)-dependent dehydrogenase (short-subunit alcohol dehydrogenase family)
MYSLQSPIGSGFGAASTTSDVINGVDLTGKVAIVTGGYSGLGRETARTLRSAGARVVVPARDLDRAAAALAGLNVEIEPMDLIDPASIDRFAQKFLASGQPLHILVNSAGIMALPKLTRDARGYEYQFATNHLGHFQLTARLLPALRQANGGRVVSVSSLGHRYSPVVFGDPNFEHHPYERWAAYGQSKTANILFAVALDARFKADGVRAFSLHPGSIVGTGLEKYLSREELIAGGILDEDGKPILDPARQLKTVEQGAATQVWCATNPKLDEKGGVYCENCEVAGVLAERPKATTIADSTRLTGVMAYAVDPEAAERLWRLSEQLVENV